MNLNATPLVLSARCMLNVLKCFCVTLCNCEGLNELSFKIELRCI